MKMNPSRRDGCWLAASGVAFVLGVGLSPLMPGQPVAPRVVDNSVMISDGSPAGLVKHRLDSAADADSPAKSWLQGYQEFCGCRDPLKRQQLLVEALAGITASNWERARQPMWDSRQEGRISEAEWKLFMQRFGAVGREKLAEKGRPDDIVNGWETSQMRFAMAGWAAEDVNGSWDWLSRLPEGNYRRGMMMGWFESAAALAPDRALREVAALDPEKEGAIWEVAAKMVSTHDPQKVKAWLDELSARPAPLVDPNDPKQKTGWVDGVFKSGPPSGEQSAKEFFGTMLKDRIDSNSDPAYGKTLKSWFEAYEGSPGVPASALGTIATILEKSQPPLEVLNWIESHPDSPGLSHALANTVVRWTNEQTADDVAAWLQAHRDSPAYDGAVAGFAVKAHQFDPEGALVWANTIKDAVQRQGVLEAFTQK